jgi:hypothetical protein
MSGSDTFWDRTGGCADAAERIVCFTEHVNATYFISFDIPFAALGRRRRIGWWTLGSTTVQRHLANSDISSLLCRISTEVRPTSLVLTRYALPAGRDILRHFQEQGVRCVYHIDDDLLGLSESLGAEILNRHGRPEVTEARRALLESADVVYASTAPLRDALAARFPHQRFATGMYRAYSPIATVAPAARPVVIGYMGSKGHARDLELVVPSIARLIGEAGCDVRFELFGTIPFPAELEPWRPSIRHYAATADYFQFRSQLSKLGWHIGLAPLVDNEFNRCKAPTKFIEYTEAGITTVASRVNVYAPHLQPVDSVASGGLCTGGDWYGTLRDLVADAEARKAMLFAARSYCSREFKLDRLAAQVESIVLPQRAETRAAASL